MISYSKNGYSIRQLSIADGRDVFDMLKRIGRDENHFQNPVHDMDYNQYKKWLIEQDDWSHERNLPEGYVGQTSFWMYVDNQPVAFGKINVISRISYEQCDENAERPPVPFAERVEHIQLVVELSQLGEEGFPVHAAEVILLF